MLPKVWVDSYHSGGHGAQRSRYVGESLHCSTKANVDEVEHSGRLSDERRALGEIIVGCVHTDSTPRGQLGNMCALRCGSEHARNACGRSAGVR